MCAITVFFVLFMIFQIMTAALYIQDLLVWSRTARRRNVVSTVPGLAYCVFFAAISFVAAVATGMLLWGVSC